MMQHKSAPFKKGEHINYLMAQGDFVPCIVYRVDSYGKILTLVSALQDVSLLRRGWIEENNLIVKHAYDIITTN